MCLCVLTEPVNQTVAALNVYSFKTVKATDFKFDTRVFRDSPNMILKIYGKGLGQGHVTPNFGALNAYSYKTVKATKFKFHVHVSIGTFRTSIKILL